MKKNIAAKNGKGEKNNVKKNEKPKKRKIIFGNNFENKEYLNLEKTHQKETINVEIFKIITCKISIVNHTRFRISLFIEKKFFRKLKHNFYKLE